MANNQKVSIRDQIRGALLSYNGLTVGDISRITGISPRKVCSAVSAMTKRTQDIEYRKTGESFGKYYLVTPAKLKVPHPKIELKDISLKLSQLKSNKKLFLSKGVSLIEHIIQDYELFLLRA